MCLRIERERERERDCVCVLEKEAYLSFEFVRDCVTVYIYRVWC